MSRGTALSTPNAGSPPLSDNTSKLPFADWRLGPVSTCAKPTRIDALVLMYPSKASDDQRPSHWIIHLGRPSEAQYVAPPEWKLWPVNENSGRYVASASRNHVLLIA